MTSTRRQTICGSEWSADVCSSDRFTSSFGLPAITTASGAGAQTVSNLSVGSSYSLSEIGQTGWDAGTLTCDHGTAPGAIAVVAGQTTTCAITNTKQGAITVNKTTVGGDGTFSFTSSFGLPAITTTSGAGAQTVSNLSVGSSYSLSEIGQTGGDAGTLTCDHGTAPGAVAGGWEERRVGEEGRSRGGAYH